MFLFGVGVVSSFELQQECFWYQSWIWICHCACMGFVASTSSSSHNSKYCTVDIDASNQ